MPRDDKPADRCADELRSRHHAVQIDALALVDADWIARQLDLNGIASIEACFSGEDVAEAESQVREFVGHRHNEYVARVGTAGLTGIMLADLANSPTFLSLCATIYRARHQNGHDASMKQVLRCLSGTTGIAESNYFHFDSYAMTVIAPIIMPQSGPPGDLILFHHFRNTTCNYVVNVLQKAILSLTPTQTLLKWASQHGYASKIRLKPGTLYFIDGERALHANEPCDPSAIRATLVIHFAEAQYDHWLKRCWKRRRTRRQASPTESVKVPEYAQG
jgi:hypothetical protein